MPRSSHRTIQENVDAQINIERELELIEKWSKKAHGIKSYEWNGAELVLETERGREVFDRNTVETVIFKEFQSVRAG